MAETPKAQKNDLDQWKFTNITHPSQNELLASKTNFVLESWNIQTSTKRRSTNEQQRVVLYQWRQLSIMTRHIIAVTTVKLQHLKRYNGSGEW